MTWLLLIIRIALYCDRAVSDAYSFDIAYIYPIFSFLSFGNAILCRPLA